MTSVIRPLTIAAATAAVLLALTGCSSASTDIVGVWGDENVSQKPSLTFTSEGSVTGTDGCNRLMGSYSQDGTTVTFSEVASTMMFCEGVDTWLSGASTATVAGDELVISDKDGAEIGTLKRAS